MSVDKDSTMTGEAPFDTSKPLSRESQGDELYTTVIRSRQEDLKSILLLGIVSFVAITPLFLLSSYSYMKRSNLHRRQLGLTPLTTKDFISRFSGIVWQREKDDFAVMMNRIKGQKGVYGGKVRQGGSEEYRSRLGEMNQGEFRRKMEQEENEEVVKRKIVEGGWIRGGEHAEQKGGN